MTRTLFYTTHTYNLSKKNEKIMQIPFSHIESGVPRRKMNHKPSHIKCQAARGRNILLKRGSSGRMHDFELWALLGLRSLTLLWGPVKISPRLHAKRPGGILRVLGRGSGLSLLLCFQLQERFLRFLPIVCLAV